MKMMDKVGWRGRWRIDKFRDVDGSIAGALRAGLSVRLASVSLSLLIVCGYLICCRG